MLDHLGALFQKVIASTARTRCRSAEELELVRDYLAIEEARFRDRVKQPARRRRGALACLVPPLILQPLVENAVQARPVAGAGRRPVLGGGPRRGPAAADRGARRRASAAARSRRGGRHRHGPAQHARAAGRALRRRPAAVDHGAGDERGHRRAAGAARGHGAGAVADPPLPRRGGRRRAGRPRSRGHAAAPTSRRWRWWARRRRARRRWSWCGGSGPTSCSSTCRCRAGTASACSKRWARTCRAAWCS